MFGSGETLPASGKTHEFVARAAPKAPRIAILETPAGFEPNAERVAGKIGEFLERRLQNYAPRISQIPARKKGTALSPDSQQIVQPILESDWIFLGPGSPTYAVRQLRDSLALQMLTARHRLGASLMLASSATLAFSTQTIPVYEIYKVGQDLHWQNGLDFFGTYGLSLVVVPHWNNTDGGEDLDTSRCYLGRERFGRLLEMLPDGMTIVGLDEHTALVMDFEAGTGLVMGNGRVTIQRNGDTHHFTTDETFALDKLGSWHVPQLDATVPADVWQAALEKEQALAEAAANSPTPSAGVLALVGARTAAREARDWTRADKLRDEIAAAGWQVNDTPDGPELIPLET